MNCSKCGRDIDNLGQDNMGVSGFPLCEDCSGITNYFEDMNIEFSSDGCPNDCMYCKRMKTSCIYEKDSTIF